MATEKWILDDGRRAEKRVTEIHTPEKMESEKVIELHMEDERPLKLKQRVIEKTKPFVYERRTETIDESGNVVDMKVESVEPKVNFQFVDHIVAGASACSHARKSGLSKEDIVEAVKESMKSSHGACHASACKKLKSKGMVEEVESKVESDNKNSIMDKVLIAVIAIQLVGLAYLFFGM